MNKKQIIPALAIIFGVSCSCASDVQSAKCAAESVVEGGQKSAAVTKEVAVSEFTGIEINGSANIVYMQTNGGRPKVTLNGKAADVDKVDVKSDGATLSVSNKESFGTLFGVGNDVTVYVSAPDITDITIKGSGSFSAKTDIDTDVLDINLTGSGDVNLRGVLCDEANAILKGSGDIGIKRLTAQRHSQIKLFGSGDIDIAFQNSGTVDCSLFGSGDIVLKGTCGSVSASASGSGDINMRKLKRK